jgi:predicted metalloenzyme YecM
LSEVIENDVYDVTYNNDYHGNPAIDIQKNITETKLHPYTFEYLIEAFPHKHKLFSNH